MYKIIVVAVAAIVFHAQPSFAADELEQAEQTTAEAAKQPGFQQAVKEKYSLTDEQMKAMQDKGIPPNQMAMIAEMAKASGKTTDQVLAMRVDQKMGWGAIAKELGVHPGEIGHAVSSLRRSERAEKAQERREAKAEMREQRKEARAERKAARAEAKAEKGKH